ncbi:hypothetical protein AVEN_260925-1, partial [Araneus ventricosus]
MCSAWFILMLLGFSFILNIKSAKVYGNEKEKVKKGNGTKDSMIKDNKNGICKLPMEKGHCKALFIRYYYDANAGACDSFDYGGCGGNANNFKTKSDCEKACAN